MKKVTEFIKWPFTFPALAIVGLYLFWLLRVPMEFSSHDMNWGNFLLGCILFCIYLIATILIWASFKHWAFGLIALLFVAVPIYGSLFFMLILVNYAFEYGEVPQLLILFLTVTFLLLAYPIIATKKSEFIENLMLRILVIIGTFFLAGGNVLYFLSFYPITILNENVDGYKYVVVEARDTDKFSNYYTFYKCKKWSLSCEELYWTLWQGTPEKIIVDEEKNEVSLFSGIFNPTLVYTYGENPRTYERYSTIQFRNHIYLISEERVVLEDIEQCDYGNYWNCDDIYIYTLYQCNLEYKSCIQLPVRFSDEYCCSNLFLEPNEKDNAIELYEGFKEEGGTLILSYGEKPQCHIKGCEILEE